MSTNPAKSPWYFVGFQELQLHFHPLIAVVVIPALVAFAVLAIPYMRYREPLSGPWFLSETGRRTGLLAALIGLVSAPILIVVDEFLLQPTAGLPSLIWRGVVPLALLGAAVLTFRSLLVRSYGASKSEVVQALFILFFVILAVLTVVGVWFRGPGMALVWPWEA